MKTTLAVLFVFIAASCYALDIPTSDGKLLRDCEIKAVEKDGVRITHSDGSVFLDFDTLPAALQKQYGWTAEKSAARKVEIENARRVMDEKAAAIKAEKAAAASKLRIQQEAERLANFEKARAEKAKEIAGAAKEKEAEETARDNEVLLSRLLIVCVLLCYFIPALIARRKSNSFAVFFVNLLSFAFYGAYLLGPISPHFALGALALAIGCWLIALMMAFRSEMFGDRKQVVQIQNVYQPPAPAPQHPRPVAVARPVAQVQTVAVPRVVSTPLPPSANPPPPTA